MLPLRLFLFKKVNSGHGAFLPPLPIRVVIAVLSAISSECHFSKFGEKYVPNIEKKIFLSEASLFDGKIVCCSIVEIFLDHFRFYPADIKHRHAAMCI